MRGSLISRARMVAPYGVSTGVMPTAVFHTPRLGTAYISVDGGIAQPFGPGEVAVVPRGAPHTLTDAPGREAKPITSFDRCNDHLTLPTVVNGEGRVSLDLLCGSFTLGEPAKDWLIGPLPDVFVVRGAEAATGFVHATLALLEAELAGEGLGASLVSDRLVEVLVVHLLRGWAREHTADQGWRASRTPT